MTTTDQAIITAYTAPVMVEPANGGDVARAGNLENTPVPTNYGDHIEQDARRPEIRVHGCRYFDAARMGGGKVDVLKLPEHGIHGGSHRIMMDRDGDQVAGITQK